MLTTDFGYSPFLHSEFVHHGANLPGQGTLKHVSVGACDLVYEELRPAFLLGGRMARIWAHDYAPLGGVTFGAREEKGNGLSYDAFRGLMDGLAESSDAGLLFWPFFPDDAPYGDWIDQWVSERGFGSIERLRVHKRAVCFIERDETGVVIDANGGEQGLVLRSKKKKEYGRQLRRLGDQGEVQFHQAKGGDEFANALEIFLKLEALGWKGELGTALICDPRTADFARACLPAMAADGKAQIDWLSVDDKAIAGLITLRAGSGLFTWKIASDPAYAKASAGVQIMLHISRQAMEDPSLDYIDSLATADHPMINHLWAGQRSISSLLIPLKPAGQRLATLAKHYYRGHDTLKAQAKALLKR